MCCAATTTEEGAGVNVVWLDTVVFAKLVGRYPDDDMALFQISEGLMSEKWSDLCRFRFVHSDDGLAYMEVYAVQDHPPEPVHLARTAS